MSIQDWTRHVLFFWIPSEVNFADECLRSSDLDYDGSKCLVTKLAAIIPRSGGRNDSAQINLLERIKLRRRRSQNVRAFGWSSSGSLASRHFSDLRPTVHSPRVCIGLSEGPDDCSHDRESQVGDERSQTNGASFHRSNTFRQPPGLERHASDVETDFQPRSGSTVAVLRKRFAELLH